MTKNDTTKVDRTPYLHTVADCAQCDQRTPVSHNGSPRCRSGSIASGGHRAHCTCDTCF